MQFLFWSLFERFKSYILGAGAFVAVLLGAYLKGRSDGKDRAKEALDKQVRKNVKLKNKINRDINSSSPDDIDKRLRDRWSRD